MTRITTTISRQERKQRRTRRPFSSSKRGRPVDEPCPALSTSVCSSCCFIAAALRRLLRLLVRRRRAAGRLRVGRRRRCRRRFCLRKWQRLTNATWPPAQPGAACLASEPALWCASSAPCSTQTPLPWLRKTAPSHRSAWRRDERRRQGGRRRKMTASQQKDQRGTAAAFADVMRCRE